MTSPVGIEAPPPPLTARLRTWAGVLSAYFTAQGLVQLAGVAAGLVFVNLMPVRELALYTLATSVLSFFAFASDLGSTTSLVYFFHQTVREGEDFRPYRAAVLSLRRAAFLAGAAAVVVALPRAALAEGFGRLETGLVTAGVLFAVWFQIRSSVAVLCLRLADRYGASYRAELAGSGARLGAALLLAALSRLAAWLGVLTAALGSAITARLARPEPEAQAPAFPLAPYRRRVVRYLLPTLPSALYFAVQAPLVVWLATAFGGTRNIAEVGALGRLGLLLGLVSGLTGVVFLPRLARITDERLYRRRALQFGGLLAVLALALLAAARLVPGLFLFLLGEHYAGLDRELLLVVAGSGLHLLDGYAVSINLARSWTRWQGLAVLSLALAQAVLIALLPLSTTAGVLLFNLLSSGFALLGQAAITSIGFLRPSWVHWR